LQWCRLGWSNKENFWRLPYILHFDIKMENVTGLEYMERAADVKFKIRLGCQGKPYL
jgi:hypothetical protein